MTSLLGSCASIKQHNSMRAFDFKIRILPPPVMDEGRCSAQDGGLSGAQAALLGPDAISMAMVPHIWCH